MAGEGGEAAMTKREYPVLWEACVEAAGDGVDRMDEANRLFHLVLLTRRIHAWGEEAAKAKDDER